MVAVTPLVACSDDATQDFVEAADEVCRAADQRLEDVELPRASDGLDRYVADVERISGDLVADLRALEPPAPDDERLSQLVEGIERATDLLDPLATAVAKDDRAALADLQQEIETITQEIGGIARSYGFESCGAKVPGAPR